MNPRATPIILVVDDVPDTLKLLTNWLEARGYETLSATGGRQALRLATEHRPDLILLDVMMPEMDGIETCRHLKMQPQTASIPVILVTAKDPGDARADGMIAGAIDYITKPVNLQDLLVRVRSVFAGENQTQIDVHRLLEEVAHTAMAMLDSALVWLLALNTERNCLVSEILTTTSGSLEESDFIVTAAGTNPVPEYSLEDVDNPLIEALITRQTTTNIGTRRFEHLESTQPLAQAAEQLHIQYVTLVPLNAAGRTAGVMMLGYYQPHDMETPRAHQILSTFGSQAATALDYARLMADLRRREEEAQDERAFRQMILDTMSDGLVVIDAQGRIKFTNRRLLRMTGYSQNYLQSRLVGELFHPDDRTEVMRGLLSEHATTMKFDQRLITQFGKVIPVLISRSRTPNNSLDNQVIVLSDMTEQKQREHDLERQTNHLQALNHAAQAITSNLSLHEVLQQILNSATSVVEAQGASLFLVNRENNSELIVVAAVGHRAEDLIGLRVPLGEGLAGWVAREAQSQLVVDPTQDERFYKLVDQQTGMHTQSLIAVPLIHAEEVIGVIEVVNKLNDGVFDTDDVRLLESMAGTAAVSIMNARLYDQSQRRVAELAALLDASEAASSTLDLSNVLEHVVRSLTDNLDVAQSIIMAWNAPKGQITPLAEVSNTTWVNGPVQELTPGSAAFTALLTGQTIIASMRGSRLSPVDKQSMEAAGMSSLLAAPIQQKSRILGLVVLSSTTPAGLSEKNIAAVERIIQQWTANLPAGIPIASSSHQALTELASDLLEISAANWVTIYSGTSDSSVVRLLREMGFIERTQHQGPGLAVADYPMMKKVIEMRTIQRVSRTNLPPDTPEHHWLVTRGGEAALIVPLLLHGVAIGMVFLIDTTDRSFDHEEIRLAQGIANVVSNAMENARLYQSLQSRARALESAYGDLQNADRAKEQFIQNISHELRTPLIHVLGYAELLADDAFGSITDEQREALRMITEKGQKVADIIEDMVAAQNTETQSLNRQPTDLVVLIQQVLDHSQERIVASGLTITTQLPPMLPPVMADAEAIAEAFEKLLDNALKFGQDGEQVEVVIRDTE
ncbi:MAG: GAF domain-containing protein, partial [Anaerolineae bacterium]|nr:GAF domain-containing protein [Anaerolineae bacterium]